MSKKFIRTIIFILVFASLMGTCAFAAQAPEPFNPQNSNYIRSYLAYVYSPAAGKAQVWIEIGANATSDLVGASYITLQSSADEVNWSNDYTFYSSSYENLLAENTAANTTYVQKNVVGGRYYRAIVNVYVARGAGDDSRIYVTDSVYIP